MHRVICPIGHIIPEQIVREGSWGRDSLLQMGTAYSRVTCPRRTGCSGVKCPRTTYSRVNGPGGHFTSRPL